MVYDNNVPKCYRSQTMNTIRYDGLTYIDYLGGGPVVSSCSFETFLFYTFYLFNTHTANFSVLIWIIYFIGYYSKAVILTASPTYQAACQNT